MKVPRVALAVLMAVAVAFTAAWARPQAPRAAGSLEEAQHLFYTARFEESAAAARELIAADQTFLAAWELRTSALHFQLRRLLGEAKDKKAALAKCAACGPLLMVFLDDTNKGRAAARARLVKNPMDDEARFFLGKMDLSYLWLQLSTLDRKTGWDEYWEAKRLLEAILEKDPTHVRARVARAWMDYIVGTRVPWGTRWVMGGGNRSRGLRMVADAAQTPADFYTRVEAQFALWEMLSREGRRQEAVAAARELLAKFPENRDLTRYLEGGAGPAAN